MNDFLVVNLLYIMKEVRQLTNKNDAKDTRKNAKKGDLPGQPEPLDGSKKVKNQNHTRQNHNQGHDM